MFLRKLLGVLFFIGFLVSCAVLPQKEQFQVTAKPLELGLIGNRDISVYKTDFEVASVPTYKDFVKISIQERKFTKSVFKKYEEATRHKETKYKVNYVDSIATKPKFYDLVIEDKTLVIESINRAYNRESLRYIRNSPGAKLVTGVRILISKEIEALWNEADAFYFRSNGLKKQEIYFFKNNKQIKVLDFKEVLVFGHKMSSFCWEITPTDKIRLATLVADGENCGLHMHRNPKQLEKKMLDKRMEF